MKLNFYIFILITALFLPQINKAAPRMLDQLPFFDDIRFGSVDGDINLHVAGSVDVEKTVRTCELIVECGAQVDGELDINGEIVADSIESACDVIVGCNILMHNSTDTLHGNIVKDGDIFLHNANDNTFLGSNAGNFSMTGNDDVGIGNFALSSLTSGSENVAIGTNALLNTTSGSENTAIGTNALANNTIGVGNFSLGFEAAENNLSGSNNIAIGHQALQANIISDANTALGFRALANCTGDSNIALGARAMEQAITARRCVAIGAASLELATSGMTNCALGNNAGYKLTGASDNNLYLGCATPVFPESTTYTESDTIRIGQPFPALGNPQHTRTFIVGISGVTTDVNDAIPVMVDSSNQLGVMSSSARFKENIRDIGTLSARILQLRPVMFNYKSDKFHKEEYGFIAEEVESIMPELVIYDTEQRPFTVKYQVLYALLLNEIKRNRDDIEALKQSVAQLSQLVAELSAIVS